MSAKPDAWAWLEQTEPVIPDPLRGRMRAAVAAVPATGEPATDLGRAALDCLRQAVREGDRRAAALHLLAADALVTHAAAAAAHQGGEALAAFADAFGARSLGQRLESGPDA